MGVSLNWDDAKLFLAIARTGSVRRAAGGLGLHHSTVLRRLDALERQLAVRLFDRSRGYAPTAAGEALRAHAETAEAALSAAEARLASGATRVSGRLRLIAPELIAAQVLAPALSGWLDRYPELSVSLEIEGGETGPEAAAAADDPAAPLPIRVWLGRTPRPDAVDRRVCGFAEAAYAGAAYAPRDRLDADPGGAALIGAKPCETSGAYPAWAEAQGLGGVPTRHAAGSVWARAAAARAGLGVAALPCLLADPDPDLVRVRGPWRAGEVWVSAPAHAKTAARAQAALAFLERALLARRKALEGVG